MLETDQAGQVDPARTRVITGRERHVAQVRPGGVGYPQRAIRTADHLYIINFKPERNPMGDPSDKVPNHNTLENNTFATSGDMDASPTKAWLVEHRDDLKGKKFYDLAFAKRPFEELYLRKQDPDQLNNVAADPQYAKIKASLHAELMEELETSGDPRVTGGGMTFEKPPFVGALKKEKKR